MAQALLVFLIAIATMAAYAEYSRNRECPPETFRRCYPMSQNPLAPCYCQPKSSNRVIYNPSKPE